MPDAPNDDKDLIGPRANNPLAPGYATMTVWGFLDGSAILR